MNDQLFYIQHNTDCAPEFRGWHIMVRNKLDETPVTVIMAQLNKTLAQDMCDTLNALACKWAGRDVFAERLGMLAASASKVILVAIGCKSEQQGEPTRDISLDWSTLTTEEAFGYVFRTVVELPVKLKKATAVEVVNRVTAKDKDIMGKRVKMKMAIAP